MRAASATASMVLALILCLTAAIGIATASSAPPSLMSRADYEAALRSVRFESRLALSRCRSEADPQDRAVCRAEARASERIGRANIELRYRGTFAAAERARAVEDRADYSVEIARRLAPT